MTENEMTAEMGSVVKELAEMRKRRACLETRAERMMANLHRGVLRIEDALAGKRGESYEPAMGAETWPSFNDLISMIADINATSVRIDALEGRLRQWGAIK